MSQDYFRSENPWKSIKIDGRQAWRCVVRGHELFAQAQNEHKNKFCWWITSDKAGTVVTARGSEKLLADAQSAAVAEARELAYGELSTRAFLPSQLHAIKTGKLQRIDGGLSDEREATNPVRRRTKGRPRNPKST